MKKIIIIILLCFPVAVIGQTTNFILKGKIGHLNAPAKAYLFYSQDDATRKDSVLIKNGNFTFKGNIAAPTRAMVIISHDGMPWLQLAKQDRKNIYLEKKTLILISADSVVHSIVLNSAINRDNRRLEEFLKPATAKYASLNKVFYEAPLDSQKSETYQKRMSAQSSIIEEQVKTLCLEFAKNNPGSLVSMDILSDYSAEIPDVKEVQAMYRQFSPAVKASPAGKKFAEYLAIRLRLDVGRPAPEFSAADTAGRQVSLKSYRGNYLLLDFWASWCAPCRAENPNVVAAYAKYHPKGFAILGVSLDNPNAKQSWIKAIHTDNLTWTHVSDLKGWKSKVPALYGVRSIPQNFLIGPDGKIVAKDLRGDDLLKVLAGIYDKTDPISK